MIWATVSSSSCVYLLYRACSSLDANNIINLILVLIPSTPTLNLHFLCHLYLPSYVTLTLCMHWELDFMVFFAGFIAFTHIHCTVSPLILTSYFPVSIGIHLLCWQIFYWVMFLVLFLEQIWLFCKKICNVNLSETISRQIHKDVPVNRINSRIFAQKVSREIWWDNGSFHSED